MNSRPHSLSVDEYEALARSGRAPAHGVELLGGSVVSMSPRGDRHTWAVRELARQFIVAEHGRYRTDPESLSLRLDDFNEPDPDVTLSWPRCDRLRPTPRDVFLIVEVADSSPDRDRVRKSKLYAAAGIPEYWIVDLIADCIETRGSPVAGHYRERAVVTRGQLSPRALPEVCIDVATVLGIDAARA